MRVLLSDGSGLTARQCATRLAAVGHHVEALAPDPWCLCRFTRSVARIRPVPTYGDDPLGWLTAALAIYRSGRFDVLFPTQEQVAVLSWGKDRLDKAGVATAVPPFSALAAVQDKISASATLQRLGVPQPPTATDTRGWARFPAFVKGPIGTASGGVRRVTTPEELQATTRDRSVLIQAGVDGPLIMCQAVFDHGSLVAFHANERTAEGASGGASHKRSVSVPQARHWFEVIGADLDWHGALSADAILGADGPVFIDINPRLVEPQNAFFSGVDLVGAILALAAGAHPARQREGRTGVATHQLILAVLGAAQHGRRGAVVADLLHAALHTHDYRASKEELTPVAGDPKSAIPLAVTAAATVVAPTTWRWFASGGVSDYALTEAGWQQLLVADPSDAPRELPDRRAPAARHRGLRRGARQASQTAALMAVQRGLETARPAGTRLFEDPLAASFVSPPWRLGLRLARIGVARRAIEATYDLVAGPGPRASAIARTKLIDDLVGQLAPSLSQIVILGAGYDTRPYRLDHLSTHAIFEVDQPETQAAKHTALRRAGAATAHVTFVPVDFETDDLDSALADAGYRCDQPTLFLWEGVTQYLSADAVDTTFSAIRRRASEGSVLVFTYVDVDVIDGELKAYPEAGKWLRGVSMRGEPWIFGIAPAETCHFLSERGFHLVDDLSTAQAGARYFEPLHRRDRGSGLYRVATAHLNAPGDA